jgi:transposase-like protein
MTRPSDRDRSILEEIKRRSYSDVAREHGVSRQRIWHIARRWHQWTSTDTVGAGQTARAITETRESGAVTDVEQKTIQ